MRVIEDKKLGRGVNASYDPRLKDIYIKNLQAKEAKISLYHELQHAIQDIEGFAYGFKDYVTSDENFHKYAIQHGEVEARNVESRMNLPTKKDVQTLKRAAKNTDKHIEYLKTSDYEEWYKNERINTEQSKKKDFLAKAQATQEVINQGKYTDHPHETMDTHINDTIAEATMHGEALSKKLGAKAGDTLKSAQKAQGQDMDLFSTFIENGTIKQETLNSYAKKLPKALNKQEFLAQIPHKDNQGYSKIQTPIGEIQINLTHAWNHLHKGNTYKKDRSLYSGAFLDTLADPLFVVKQAYTPSPKVSANAREMQNSKLVQTRDTESIAQDSYVFFKPYKVKDKYTYMVGYALDIQGNIINTTFIPMTSRDFGRIKKMFSSQVLYAKL